VLRLSVTLRAFCVMSVVSTDTDYDARIQRAISSIDGFFPVAKIAVR
jgi:hypothetical protein